MNDRTRQPTENGALAQARARLKAGSPADITRGMSLLETALAEGDSKAHIQMAVLRAMGVGAPQDWRLALDHLLTAAGAGSASAQRQLQILAGQDRDDWASLRQVVRLEDWALPADKQVLSASPRIVAIDRFLSPAACDWIIARAAHNLAPAMVYGADAQAERAAGARSNSAFEFGFLDLDLVILMARTRIAATIGVPVGALEPPQVLRYEVGERFARHYDYLDPNIAGHADDIARRGQRMVTFLVYLNGAFEGGETDFPHLGVRRRGEAGDALYFANLDPSGAPDRRTLHEGRAPTRGRKWLLSQWIRNQVHV
jgi:prolyl 4-hydroxylase